MRTKKNITKIQRCIRIGKINNSEFLCGNLCEKCNEYYSCSSEQKLPESDYLVLQIVENNVNINRRHLNEV
jgi:hypothetical protein